MGDIGQQTRKKMGSYSPDKHVSVPVGPPRLPLDASPFRHQTPSLPVMRHSPSVQTLNFPLGLQALDLFRAKLQSRPGNEFVAENVDSPPRPLRIKKIRKSPSMPLGGTRHPRPSPPLPVSSRAPPPRSRGFLGMPFPPQPRPRSSSASALLTNSVGHIKGRGTNVAPGPKSDTVRRASSQRQSERKELPGAGMAWLRRAKSVRPLTSLNHAPTSETLDDIQSGASFCPPSGYQNTRKRSWHIPQSRDSSGDATAGTSHRSSSYQFLDDEPTAQDGDILEATEKGPNRHQSASGTSRNGKKNRGDFRSLHVSEKGLNHEESGDKAPAKGWKEKMFSRDFFTRGGGSVTPKKEEKTRTDSVSSITTLKLESTPRPKTSLGKSGFLRIDIPSNNGWCERGDRQSRIGTGAWKLDGNTTASSQVGSGVKPRTDFNDSVLGIFERSVGGKGYTRLKKAGHWKSPMLKLQMEVVAETEKVPITYLGGDNKVVWVSIELDGKVDKGTECFEGSKVGLDVAVLMDISAYTSSTSFAYMKLQARRIVDAMETASDRVAVMTFPVVPPDTGSDPIQQEAVHVLNSSGSVAKKQLMDDISSMIQNKWSMNPAARNVREAVLASINKLKGMPLDTARYGTRRHRHLFLLTAKLETGEIELVPEVFFGEIQIHVVGIGALFWPRNEMGVSGWCMPTRTLGPRPHLTRSKTNKLDDSAVGSEIEEVGVEETIKILRKAVDLGALYDLDIELLAGENCSIRAVMGDLRYTKILPGEKRSILVQIQVGDMPIPDNNDYDLDGHYEVMPKWIIQERQLEAALGELKSRLISVRATYKHSNFSEDTTLSMKRNLDISRFAEDSLWRFSPAGNKRVGKKESPPMTPIIAEDYVKRVLLQRVASMHSSPSRALRAVQEIAGGTCRMLTNFNEISRELTYRDKVERKFQSAKDRNSRSPEKELLINLTDRSDDHALIPRSSREDIAIAMDLTPPQLPNLALEVVPITPVHRDYRYCGSQEFQNEDRTSFIAAMGSSPGIERPDIDPEDEAQRIWKEIRMRQQGVSSNSIKRRSVRSKKVVSSYGIEQLQDRFGDIVDSGNPLSTAHSSALVPGQEIEFNDEGDGEQEVRCCSGREIMHSLVTLRDVRETDFGPWAL